MMGGMGGGGGGAQQQQPPSNFNNQRPPPPPVATKGPNSIPAPRREGDISNRPDLNFGRGNMNDGVNLSENYINPYESKSTRGAPPPLPQNPRPEMRGPSDINNILSGLKTKNVNITASASASASNANQASEDKGSTISISELKDLQNDNMPNKTKRKPKSERNTISLDI